VLLTFYKCYIKWQRNTVKRYYDTELFQRIWMRVMNLDALEEAYVTRCHTWT